MLWIRKRKHIPNISPILVASYLLHRFKNGSSTSSINSIRSAINFFTLSVLDLENSLIIKKLFKYFYKQRPLCPRYTTFWPVEQLLNFLKSWFPLDSLSLKQLTLKTIALIALTSSDRGQTLHKATIHNMKVSSNKIEFVIRERVKNTRKILKPTIITCVSSAISELDVASHVSFYIEKTNEFRDEKGQLFLSWVTKKPVVRQSLARWLKQVLGLAGIDTSVYKSHSYRGAGLSHAFQKGASIDQIVSAGNWANSSTFKMYYNAPSHTSDVGNLILGDHNLQE